MANSDHGTTRTSALTRYWWIGVLGILAVGGGVVALGGGAGQRPDPTTTVAAARGTAVAARRETRPTLDPAQFVGKARTAHQVARDIPDVLDQLYCYCQCDKSIGHKSLLSCYTDGHAAT